MNDFIRRAEERAAAEKQQRALNHVKHLCRVEREQAALTSMIDAVKANASDNAYALPAMRKKAAKYAHILDGLFDHYLEKSKDPDSHDHAIGRVLHTHAQALRSIRLWQSLEDSKTRGTD